MDDVKVDDRIGGMLRVVYSTHKFVAGRVLFSSSSKDNRHHDIKLWVAAKGLIWTYANSSIKIISRRMK